jgi:hypothetical protein
VDNKPRALAWTVVNLKNHRQCKVAYDAVRAENYRQAVTNNMICAADDTNRRDSCQVGISYLRTSANFWLSFDFRETLVVHCCATEKSTVLYHMDTDVHNSTLLAFTPKSQPSENGSNNGQPFNKHMVNSEFILFYLYSAKYKATGTH